ncbi:MAG: DUF4243 domain-containing protein [Deltaproteobacteria bacterium]|nr:DUF4243 domain-containing protein [Deltaproteobacteria bacterium]
MTSTHDRARAALEALSDLSPEYGPQLTDHAPMVVEALERIEPSAIEPFLARTLPRLRPLDREPDPALHAFAASARLVAQGLERDGADHVLEETAPALGRSVAGAAFHGIIRIAHALRGLDRDPHPTRRAELARALTYAAVRADVLPQRPLARARDTLTLGEALARLSPAPDALEPRPGLITPTLVARAAAHPELGTISAALRREGEPVERARALRREAASLLTRGEHAKTTTFTLLHAVTGAEAVLTLARKLSAERAHELVDEGAHALLAMRVAFVGRLDRPLVAAPPWRELVTRAVTSLDDHAIKLAAAMEDDEGLDDDVRRAALWAWLERVEGESARAPSPRDRAS